MKLKPFFLPLITLLSLSSCTLPAQTASTWQPRTFNGKEFVPGESKEMPSFWIRDGFIPRTDKPGDQVVNIGRLPAKVGAVAGICYLQSSGGKLSDKSGVTPYADEQITIKSAREGIFVARTDDNGLFIETLYPGEYEFSCRGAGSSAIVTEGKTTLVHIKGGKRMAD
ncbi:MAG TPA: hypothetical protein VFF53_02240 [Geobacteraceae bacterium]|nr:hypothetical protein [Geobacteraceae bacterium]